MNPTRIASGLVVLAIVGCAGREPEASQVSASTAEVVSLPQAGNAPWGGDDPAHWGPEAVLANAASAALNAAWSLDDVEDVVVAVPVALRPSDFHPFGDGQSNAMVTFPYWNADAPPLVATMAWIDAPGHGAHRTADAQFHRDISAGMSGAFELYVWSGGWSEPTIAEGERVEGRWKVALHDHLAEGELDAPIFIRPVGWGDGFALDFAHPRSSVEQLVEAMPSAHRTTVQHLPVIDPLNVATPSSGTVFDALLRTKMPSGFNPAPYVSGDVHGAYPLFGQFVPTATGQSWTWLAQPPLAPIKDIYICFEPRDPLDEAALGVPSGAGWHRIGDPAESLVNSLEEVPIPVSYVRGGEELPPAVGSHAYQLTQVATYRLLRPGEAFTVQAPDYHGYIVPYGQPVCTQILVHPAW